MGTPLPNRLLCHRPMYQPSKSMVHLHLLSMFLAMPISGPPLAIHVLRVRIQSATTSLPGVGTLLLILCQSQRLYPRNALRRLNHLRHSTSSHDRVDNHTATHRIHRSIRDQVTTVLQHPIPNMRPVLPQHIHIRSRNPTSRNHNLPSMHLTRPMAPNPHTLSTHLPKLSILHIRLRLKRNHRTHFLIRRHSSRCIIPKPHVPPMFLQRIPCMLGMRGSR